MREIFIEAEEIANSPKGVTTAASSDERMRTVRSSTSDQPLIVSPNPKNRNLLQCKCKTNVCHLIYENALAFALNLGITFDFLVEVKKKTLTNPKSKGFILKGSEYECKYQRKRSEKKKKTDSK